MININVSVQALIQFKTVSVSSVGLQSKDVLTVDQTLLVINASQVFTCLLTRSNVWLLFAIKSIKMDIVKSVI